MPSGACRLKGAHARSPVPSLHDSLRRAFLPTLSHALLDGALIDGFPGSGGAMALADATIYVPTQRAAEALAEALLAASGERSLILPRIAPLGAFEPDETATAFAAESDVAPPRSALPRAVGTWPAAMCSQP